MRTNPPIATHGGIAARAGRWSAQHRKKAILGWLAFVIIALFAGTSAGLHEPAPSAAYDGESRQAERVLEDAGYRVPAGEMVLVQSKTKTATDPAFRDAVADVKRAVSRQAAVERVTGRLLFLGIFGSLLERDIGHARFVCPQAHQVYR